MHPILLALVQLFFLFCVIFAIISDYRSLTIPNWISIALIAGFAVYAALTWDKIQILDHVAIAGGVFVTGFIFFLLNWFGGGDVKLLTAVSLWAGPQQGMNFVILMCLLGGVLSIGLLWIRRTLRYRPNFGANLPFIQKVAELAEQGICPYGIAIGIAAILTIPTNL